jgi:hypothetical protein
MRTVARCPCMFFLIQQARLATNALEMKGSGSQRGVSVDLGRNPRSCFLRMADTCALTSLARGRRINSDGALCRVRRNGQPERERLKGRLAPVYESNNGSVEV